MQHQISRHFLVTFVTAGCLMLASADFLAQTGSTPAERVAALKQNLAQSQKLLRQYQWTETTMIGLKGEEKARTQKRCFYGADGKLQKTPIGEPAAAASGGGGRGRLATRVVENKKDDMKEYMAQASALIQKYVPPNAEAIQNARERMKLDAGANQVRLTFTDYLLPGDHVSIDVDPKDSHLLGLAVASYIDKKEDTVTLEVTTGTLTGGITYISESTLDAAAKNIRVVIENAAYKPVVK